MARDTIPVLDAAGTINPASVEGTALTGVALNDAEWILTRGDLLVAHNPTGGPISCSVIGTQGAGGRTEDAGPVAIDAGNSAVFGPFDFLGWEQSGVDAGKVFADFDTDGLLLFVVRLAGSL